MDFWSGGHSGEKLVSSVANVGWSVVPTLHLLIIWDRFSQRDLLLRES
ncbi:hypothetical protein RBSH_03867 [Rhodopirellula baltica SH28]|uniref:Uncharacterized protein n=2 Tax=Rhodopirellula baltica TaxID=265606 RepID=F2AS29_RHOBT|nr:hypothetical protein RBWH47_02476 [Rhodopirellula baltica WH47]EKK00840.1 hypothetical protein RBSH_03867 [Rhodopirellula baltica SH28]